MYKVIKKVIGEFSFQNEEEEVMIIDADIKQIENYYAPKFQKVADAEVLIHNLVLRNVTVRYIFQKIESANDSFIDKYINCYIKIKVDQYNEQIHSRNQIVLKNNNRDKSRAVEMFDKVDIKMFDNPFYKVNLLTDSINKNNVVIVESKKIV